LLFEGEVFFSVALFFLVCFLATGGTVGVFVGKKLSINLPPNQINPMKSRTHNPARSIFPILLCCKGNKEQKNPKDDNHPITIIFLNFITHLPDPGFLNALG
jgi:hypothetical protein